mmetsp:Transcript_27565/g.88484  ORF Transcript_27565/g.88484 Transcript_27565/m.88484 type:complete len:203 (+) Transcript_27565:199-807(+)
MAPSGSSLSPEPAASDVSSASSASSASACTCLSAMETSPQEPSPPKRAEASHAALAGAAAPASSATVYLPVTSSHATATPVRPFSSGRPRIPRSTTRDSSSGALVAAAKVPPAPPVAGPASHVPQRWRRRACSASLCPFADASAISASPIWRSKPHAAALPGRSAEAARSSRTHRAPSCPRRRRRPAQEAPESSGGGAAAGS